MKKILMVNTGRNDITSRRAWSGIPFSVYNEMVKYYEVDTLRISGRVWNPFEQIRKLYYKIKGTKYLSDYTKTYARKASRKLAKHLKDGQYDLVLVFNTVAPIACLMTDVPVIYYSDMTVVLLDGYYYDVAPGMKKEAIALQKKAYEKLSHIVVSSNWVKNSIVGDYGIDESKITVALFGANIEVDEFEKIEHEGINILFSGIGWERKGGDVAVDMMRSISAMDPDTDYKLYIVGSEPPYQVDDDNIEVVGYLNRDIPEQREKMEYLRRIADIFVLPTHAECAGIVFCEACAYSLPSVTYDTGGIPDYVINGFNGYRLPVNATGEDFAAKVTEIIHGEKLPAMRQNARKLYETELNWKRTGECIKPVIDSLTE